MSNRFDLEQAIMNCWNVTNDIDVIINAVKAEKLSNEAAVQALEGLKNLYDIKFDNMFGIFEDCIHNKKI